MTGPAVRTHPIHAARPGSRPLTAEDLWNLPRVGAASAHPDGNACVVPVTTWDLEKNESRSRLWWAPRGGEPRPLTSEEFSSTEPVISPDGRQVAFTRKKDQGKAQLHVMPLDGGEARCLTSLPLGVFDPRWLPDGSGVVFGAMLLNGHLSPEATAAELARREKDPVKAYVTEERVFRYWDQWLTNGEVPHLFLYDLVRGALRDLTPQSDVWFDWMEMSGNYDISPDGAEIALSGITRREPGVRTYLYTVPVAGGPMTCLTADHPAHDLTPRYSPDGTTLVYGMQHDPDFYADRVRLMVYHRAARTHREACPGWTLSPSHWTFGKDGTLFVTAEEEARTSLFAWKGEPAPARIVRGGTVSGVSTAAGRLWFTRQDLCRPPEVYVQHVSGGSPEQVTHFTDKIASQYRTGEVRELVFEGSYGAEIQMFVVLPPDYEDGRRYPLVQVVHGGPHSISGDAFSFRWNPQLFAAPGYVIALVNFQGSTSWGQDYAQRIQGRWGDQPYLDVMRATDVLVASGLVDEQRMAVAGGSYGGYLVTWIEGHTDRFKCIVNHAGIYETLSFQYASDMTQGRHKSLGGQAWDNLEGLDRYNPSRFTAGFKTPMLVIHGERDFRVPVTQGLACYGVLKAKGVPARLVYFPDENHWVLKARNSLLWYREVHAWLERWLGKT
jgi:dipeptidyl aminopeptidase/acylaminoacyl peptidase